MALPTTLSRRPRVTDEPFGDLQREFDVMLNRFFGGVPQATNGRRSAPYAVDIHEDDNHLYFEVELPGFRKEDLDITLDNNTITITAERQSATESGGEKPEGEAARPRRETLLNERRYTYFSRSFSLPPTVSSENPDAKLQDGVLHLTLNKREETKPRKISVA